MTTTHAISEQLSIDLGIELPSPDVTIKPAARLNEAPALPRPLPDVNDTGRILFGASCRIPLQK